MLIIFFSQIQSETVLFIVKYYCQAVMSGTDYILQTLPSLLNNWLDFSNIIAKYESMRSGFSDSLKLTVQNVQKQLNSMIRSMRKSVKSSILLQVLPQLISRIAHNNVDAYDELKLIIVDLLADYHQQTIWYLISQHNSSHSVRSSRCAEIFNLAKDRNPNLKKFIPDVIQLVKLLLEMCNKKISSHSNPDLGYSIADYFPELYKLVNKAGFSQIIIPTESQLKLYGPHLDSDTDLVFINGFGHKFEMLNSLQKPKKFSFFGSDGNFYTMLSKPHDDLRKDARLMEINHLLNSFLMQDVECHKRNLHINTYVMNFLSLSYFFKLKKNLS